MSRATIPTENQEQRALVSWLNYHPIVHNYFCKITNEGKRSQSQGFNLKLMGLHSGVSDLLIYYPSRVFHGLFLEVKRNKIYTKSEMNTDTWIAQQQFLESVNSVGYVGKMCYGFEDGKSIVESYLLT